MLRINTHLMKDIGRLVVDRRLQKVGVDSNLRAVIALHQTM